MALHYGLNTANYPLAEDDFEKGGLPDALIINKERLFGINIDSIQLHKIRQKRRADSSYLVLSQCQVSRGQQFYKRYRMPHADSTAMSIEEFASMIAHRMNLEVNYL